MPSYRFRIRYSGRGAVAPRVNKVTGHYSLAPEQILRPTFLQRCSKFNSYADLKRQSGLPEVKEAGSDLPVDELRRRWDEFITESTDYSSTQELLKAAAEDWARSFYAGEPIIPVASSGTQQAPPAGEPPSSTAPALPTFDPSKIPAERIEAMAKDGLAKIKSENLFPIKGPGGTLISPGGSATAAVVQIINGEGQILNLVLAYKPPFRGRRNSNTAHSRREPKGTYRIVAKPIGANQDPYGLMDAFVFGERRASYLESVATVLDAAIELVPLGTLAKYSFGFGGNFFDALVTTIGDAALITTAAISLGGKLVGAMRFLEKAETVANIAQGVFETGQAVAIYFSDESDDTTRHALEATVRILGGVIGVRQTINTHVHGITPSRKPTATPHPTKPDLEEPPLRTPNTVGSTPDTKSPAKIATDPTPRPQEKVDGSETILADASGAANNAAIETKPKSTNVAADDTPSTKQLDHPPKGQAKATERLQSAPFVPKYDPCDPKTPNPPPILPFVQQLLEHANNELVKRIGDRSRRYQLRKGIRGTSQNIGTKLHSYAKRLLCRYERMFGYRGLLPERSYKAGTEVPYSTKDSVRPDVFNPDSGKVWDYKFGKSSMSRRQINRYWEHVPNISTIEEVKR